MKHELTARQRRNRAAWQIVGYVLAIIAILGISGFIIWKMGWDEMRLPMD